MDGKLYYYDPRDDDYWTVERFVRQIHGQNSKVEDHLYVKDGTDDTWKRWIKKYSYSALQYFILTL